MNAVDRNLARDVVQAFGGLTGASKALGGCPVSTIHAWVKSGKIPQWRHRALIEAAEKARVDLPNDFMAEVAR